MNDDSISQDGDKDPETGLATPEILDHWLGKESMSLWHAAFIAHGANPVQQGSGLHADRVADVLATEDFLSRSTKLKVVRTVGDQELYATSEIFQTLAERKGWKFPAPVSEMLLEKKLIRLGIQVRPQRHANAERYETERTKVLHAMVWVLADPILHPTCRKGGAIDGPVTGADLARTIVAKCDTLFEGGELPMKSETIAKLFNDIVPPQVR